MDPVRIPRQVLVTIGGWARPDSNGSTDEVARPAIKRGPCNVVESFNFTSGTWKPHYSLRPPCNRAFHSIEVVGNKVIRALLYALTTRNIKNKVDQILTDIYYSDVHGWWL